MFKKIQKTVSIVILIAFIANGLGPTPTAKAEPIYSVEGELHLPAPGILVHLSPEYTPSHLLGVTIHPENALQFDFLIHKGDQFLDSDQKKVEYKKLVKYFLASLTIPDEDQWVNLSPYEHDRIIKDDFGKTEMGRDLLAQDYMLKQITSSLIYPEDGLGKRFWDKIYERAWNEYHTTNIPVNTFNKVWIVPDQAIVYESGNTAYILKSHLKVMLEEDYLSLEKHNGIIKGPSSTHSIGSQVTHEIILPELEKEVNEGKNFANLRQMFSGMILATWYKKALKESLLGKVYADKARVKGVDQDPKTNEVIYQRYLKAFKKGVFNYIREDVDKYTNEAIPRKYFSGGFKKTGRGDLAVTVIKEGEYIPPGDFDSAVLSKGSALMDQIKISLAEEGQNTAGATRRHVMRLATLAAAGSRVLAQSPESPAARPDIKSSIIDALRKRVRGRSPENPFLARTLDPDAVEALVSKYQGKMKHNTSLRYDRSTHELFYDVTNSPDGEFDFKFETGKERSFAKRFLQVVDLKVTGGYLYVARSQGNGYEYFKINQEGQEPPTDQDLRSLKWNGNFRSGNMPAKEIASFIEEEKGEFPAGVVPIAPKYAFITIGPIKNILGLGVSSPQRNFFMHNWYKKDGAYEDQVIMYVDDAHYSGGNVQSGIYDDVMGKVSKAMVAGEIIDPKEHLRLLGGHDEPVASRKSGGYYQVDLFRYPGEDYSVGLQFYPTPSSNPGARKTVVAALGTHNPQTAESIFANKGLMELVIEYHSRPNVDISSRIKSLLESAERDLNIVSRKASAAMVAAPALSVGMADILARGKTAALKWGNDAWKDRMADLIGSWIRAFIKKGNADGAKKLAEMLENYFRVEDRVILGITSEETAVRVVGNTLWVLDIAVARIAPELTVDNKKLRSLVDVLIKRIHDRYDLNGAEINRVQELATNLGKASDARRSVMFRVEDIIRNFINEGPQPRAEDLARKLDDYFEEEHHITLGLHLEREDVQIHYTWLIVLGKRVANIYPKNKKLILENLYPLMNEIGKRIKKEYGLDEAMSSQGTPPVSGAHQIPAELPRPENLVGSRDNREIITVDVPNDILGSNLRDHILSKLDGFKKGNKLILKAGGRSPVELGTLNREKENIADGLVERVMNLRTIPDNSAAMVTPGGIDFNAAHLNLQIRRDGRGVPLPLVQQDMAQLSHIEGFEAEIIEIKPAVNVPIISELQQKLQASSA